MKKFLLAFCLVFSGLFASNPYQGSSYSGLMDVFYEEAMPGDIPALRLETDRTYIVPVTSSEIPFYVERLLGNAETMQRYADMRPRTYEEVKKRVTGWEMRWRTGDYFSGMVIHEKATGKMIGHVVLGHGDVQGTGEYAILIDPDMWDQGYGKEVTYAVFYGLAPWLVKNGKLVNMNEEGILPDTLKKITTGARRDNFTNPIFRRMGLEIVETSEKSGFIRDYFEYSLND